MAAKEENRIFLCSLSKLILVRSFMHILFYLLNSIIH
jgi:hypothetical protein